MSSGEGRAEPPAAAGEPSALGFPQQKGGCAAPWAGLAPGARTAELLRVVHGGRELRPEHVVVLGLLMGNIWRCRPEGYEPSGDLINSKKSTRSSKNSRWGKKRRVQRNQPSCVLWLEVLSALTSLPAAS